MFKRSKILLAIPFLLIVTSCNINYLEYYQHIESPDGKYNYALYSDFGIGDPGFLVLKLEKEVDPKELKIDYSLRNGISSDDAEWMYSREILSNYDEASLYCKDPKFELIDNRFLVFSRGGFMFSLYDIKIEKDTFNNCCPWNEWASQNIWAEQGTDYKGTIQKNEKSDYGIWIEKNIDMKIKEYIEKNR